MEEKIKAFFEETGKEATDYLIYGAAILITLGESSYTVKVSKEGAAVEVEKDGKGNCEIEIITEEKIMTDLLSSSSLNEFREKMVSYTVNDQRPTVKILLERTEKNAQRFFRGYINWLRRTCLFR
jgi:hypothetical protein